MENELWKFAGQLGFGVGMSIGLFGIFKWLLKKVIENYQAQLARHEDIITNHIGENTKAMQQVAVILTQLTAKTDK